MTSLNCGWFRLEADSSLHGIWVHWLGTSLRFLIEEKKHCVDLDKATNVFVHILSVYFNIFQWWLHVSTVPSSLQSHVCPDSCSWSSWVNWSMGSCEISPRSLGYRITMQKRPECWQWTRWFVCYSGWVSKPLPSPTLPLALISFPSQAVPLYIALTMHARHWFHLVHSWGFWKNIYTFNTNHASGKFPYVW